MLARKRDFILVASRAVVSAIQRQQASLVNLLVAAPFHRELDHLHALGLSHFILGAGELSYGLRRQEFLQVPAYEFFGNEEWIGALPAFRVEHVTVTVQLKI
jgi:hypothetical protein